MAVGEKRVLKGGLTLEAALVLPMVLVILFAFIGAVQGQEEAMVLSHALDQTAREVALLLPLADLAEAWGKVIRP